MKRKLLFYLFLGMFAFNAIACSSDNKSANQKQPSAETSDGAKETPVENESEKESSEKEVVEITPTEANLSADSVQQQVSVRAIPTSDGDVCAFITNNSDTTIDFLDIQVLYRDESGAIIDMDGDGHDMVLPGSTVVSKMDAPDFYSTLETAVNAELGQTPGYENHSADIEISANQGDNCVIVEIKNNSDVDIEEIEYIIVFYKGDTIASVSHTNDIYDIAAGSSVIEKESTYRIDYDKFEVYLNQAHTFGL